MKFKGDKPGMCITSAKTGKLIGRLNAQGVLVNADGIVDVDDPKLCKRLLTVLEKYEEFICKQCGETFGTKGYLLAHYRKEHYDSK